MRMTATNMARILNRPTPTITGSGQHVAQVCAFFVKYFGAAEHGFSPKDPLHTVTGKARMGLVMVEGTAYQIVDIGLRMLTDGELLRAQFGKFAAGYKLIGSIADRISAIGNSVPPEEAELLVLANY